MRIHLTRRYAFAASHRLHSPVLSEEENRRTYGKCSNPYGHGHNYVLEVSVVGPVDPATGMVAHLGDLDAFVKREVLDAFDHRYLNEEISEFADLVATSENVCIAIFNRLRAFPGARLVGVRLEETSLNSFAYTGESDGSQP